MITMLSVRRVGRMSFDEEPSATGSVGRRRDTLIIERERTAPGKTAPLHAEHPEDPPNFDAVALRAQMLLRSIIRL